MALPRSSRREIQTVALAESNKVYVALLAAGVDRSEAAEDAARVYDMEYRAEARDSYGEDFCDERPDLPSEPDDDE